MRVELAKLHKKLGKTIIYVTHDQVEAMTLADKIVIINNGEVMQEGESLEIYNNPTNLFVNLDVFDLTKPSEKISQLGLICPTRTLPVILS